MKYVIAFLICFTILSATAQVSQNASTVIFEKGNAVRAFKLPLKMICTFKDGRTQQLILENISNDTLTFKKYYNQQNFDCTVNSIAWIKVNSSQKIVKNTLFATSVAFTSLLATLTAADFLNALSSQDIGEGAFYMIVFSIPITLISSIGIIVNADALPVCYDTNKWKLYVK